MQKPIPTKVHGVLDYMTAAFLHTLPRVLGWSDNVTRVLDVAAGGATGYSLFTDYELGLVRRLGMPAHLGLDAVLGALLASSPWLFGFADRVAWPHVGFGILAIAAALVTRTVADDRRSPVG